MTDFQQTFDVAIIGGGIGSMTTAYKLALQNKQLRVAIIECGKLFCFCG